MRLTRFTDYTLRTLMYLALHPDSYVTIGEIARAFRISPNHLMKVVQHLAAEGDVVTMRGQHGGLRLARPAETIRLGQVVMKAEPDMDMLPAEVFGDACADAPLDAPHAVPPIAPNLPPGVAPSSVVLPGVVPPGAIGVIVAQARDAFLATLDRHTVADLIADRAALGSLLHRAREPLAAETT